MKYSILRIFFQGVKFLLCLILWIGNLTPCTMAAENVKLNVELNVDTNGTCACVDTMCTKTYRMQQA